VAALTAAAAAPLAALRGSEPRAPATTQPAATRPATGPAKKAVTVTIYATGDLHEHTNWLPYIAGYVKAAKARDPNTLLVDAGDLVNHGEQAMKITRGEGMVSLMAASGYDACVLGNHDFSRGKNRLLELCRKYPAFPLLMANVKWEPAEAEWAKRIAPFRIFKLQGVTVAVVGTASHDLRYATRDRFAVYYQVAAVHRYVPYLRKHSDIVVALTHQYEKYDWRTACGPNAPDLILGGHSHGAYFRPYGQEKKSYILKPGPYGRKLGRVRIKWDGKKIVSRQGELLDVKKDWPTDKKTAELRQKYIDAAAAPKKQKVSKTR